MGRAEIGKDLPAICDYNRSMETLFIPMRLALFVLAILLLSWLSFRALR